MEDLISDRLVVYLSIGLGLKFYLLNQTVYTCKKKQKMFA